jgi:predicted RNA-binding Zn-ribbon protein involved in translation (DUF1610 family)
VIFKVPNKAAGRGLLKEIWVVGNRFQAEIFVPSKADSLCSIYNMWGHSKFRCYSRKPACGICDGERRTAEHKCEVVTCKALARRCDHVAVKCPNCGEAHQVQDRKCRMKLAAIEMARGAGHPIARRPQTTDWTEVEAKITATNSAAAANTMTENAAATNAAAENATAANVAAENTEAESDTEMTASGTTPPMTS